MLSQIFEMILGFGVIFLSVFLIVILPVWLLLKTGRRIDKIRQTENKERKGTH